MRQATYIGRNPKYRGATALIRPGKRGKILAQFDDIKRFDEKAFGWHEFLRKSWSVHL